MARDKLKTFWLEMRRKFKVLEMYERTVKRLDGIGIAKKIKRSDSDDVPDKPGKKRRRKNLEQGDSSKTRAGLSKQTKRSHELEDHKPPNHYESVASKPRIGDIFDCKVGQPTRRGRKSERACRICGYKIMTKCKNIKRMKCCLKECHQGCWDAQETSGEAKCINMKYFVKRGGKAPDLTAQPCTRVIEDPMDHVGCDLSVSYTHLRAHET